MKIKNHHVRFDLSEPSSIRGLVWLIGGIIAFAFLYFSGVEKAMTAIAIISAIAGGLGVAIKDAKEPDE